MARKVIVRRLTGASVFNVLLAISFPHAVKTICDAVLPRPAVCPEIGATPSSGDENAYLWWITRDDGGRRTPDDSGAVLSGLDLPAQVVDPLGKKAVTSDHGAA